MQQRHLGFLLWTGCSILEGARNKLSTRTWFCVVQFHRDLTYSCPKFPNSATSLEIGFLSSFISCFVSLEYIYIFFALTEHIYNHYFIFFVCKLLQFILIMCHYELFVELFSFFLSFSPMWFRLLCWELYVWSSLLFFLIWFPPPSHTSLFLFKFLFSSTISSVQISSRS